VPEQSIHRLPEEFGGNEWLVDELYERYQADKNSVDTKWWPLFESFDADESATNGRHAAPNSAPITAQIPVVPARVPAPAAPVAGGVVGLKGLEQGPPLCVHRILVRLVALVQLIDEPLVSAKFLG
jgi:hypothetical protein